MTEKDIMLWWEIADLLRTVYSFLQDREWGRCQRVCKQWKKVVNKADYLARKFPYKFGSNTLRYKPWDGKIPLAPGNTMILGSNEFIKRVISEIIPNIPRQGIDKKEIGIHSFKDSDSVNLGIDRSSFMTWNSSASIRAWMEKRMKHIWAKRPDPAVIFMEVPEKRRVTDYNKYCLDNIIYSSRHALLKCVLYGSHASPQTLHNIQQIILDKKFASSEEFITELRTVYTKGVPFFLPLSDAIPCSRDFDGVVVHLNPDAGRISIIPTKSAI